MTELNTLQHHVRKNNHQHRHISNLLAPEGSNSQIDNWESLPLYMSQAVSGWWSLEI